MISLKGVSARVSQTCLAIFSLWLPLTATAADISLKPSVGITGEYNDNVNFREIDRESDYIATLAPALALDYATDLLRLSSGLDVRILRYAERTNLDNEYYRFNFNGTYRMLERLRLSGRFSYLRDETLESELEETGLLTRREDRQRFNIGAGVSYVLDPLTDLGLDFGHEITDYGGIGNVDYHNSSISLSCSRRLKNLPGTLTVRPSYTNYDSDINQVDTFAVSFGWTHSFAETLNLTASLGVRHTRTTLTLTRTEIVPVPTIPPGLLFRLETREVEAVERNWGGLANLSLTKTWETYSANIDYRHDLRYSSRGEPINTDRFSFGMSKSITSRFRAGFSGNAYKTKTASEITLTDSRHFDLGPYLQYNLTQDHLLRVQYTYSNHNDKTGSGDVSRDRNRVWVTLDLRFPRRWVP